MPRWRSGIQVSVDWSAEGLTAELRGNGPKLCASGLVRLDRLLGLDEVMRRDRHRLLLQLSEEDFGEDRAAERLLLDGCGRIRDRVRPVHSLWAELSRQTNLSGERSRRRQA